MTRQRRIPTPSWERDRGISGNLSGTRGQIIALVGASILVIAAIVFIGYGFLKNYLDDQHRPDTAALQIGDYEYTVKDFTNRTKMYVSQISGTTNYTVIPSIASALIEQALLLKYAGPDKNVTATDDEVKDQVATLLGIKKDDANFDQRYQEELKTTGLSDQQYQDMARSAVLRTKMTTYFSDNLSTTADSIHYRQITVADQATADKLKAQIDGGASFEELAKANSTDTGTKDKGGDAGWVPKGYLATTLDGLLFSLDTNQVVSQTNNQTGSVTLYQVTEKDPAHPVEDTKKATLAANDYQKWLNDKKGPETVVDEVDIYSTSGNTDKIRYIIDNAGLTVQ